MTVHAVKSYIAQQMATTSVQNTLWQKLVAFTQFPKDTDPLLGPCIAVVGKYKRPETRLRGPRGQGTKQFEWTLDIKIQATSSDTVKGGDAFDVLVENACDVFRLGPGAATITDSITGKVSAITHLGERMTAANDVPTSETDPPVDITFMATLTLLFTETAQPL